MLNKNTAPYFDSFDESKQFYQVLYRPTYPVQARELNEMQSILQNQIQQFGNHVFKEGSMVIPGQLAVNFRFPSIKIESQFSGVDVNNYLQSLIDSDVILTGQTSGVTAKLISYTEATDSDPLTVFVRYLGSGGAGDVPTFVAGENILSDEPTPRGFTILAAGENPVTYGTVVNIQRGIYFVRGKFVLVTEQTLVLSKYSTTTDAKVGLVVSEQFVTPEEDNSLLDNAQGSSNYAAPGAHRHFINLTLTVNGEGNNFIELLSIKDGRIQQLVETSTYSILEETLARRTYDESGNYTVIPFSITAAEHRDNNRGEFKANTEYLVGDVFTTNNRSYVVETAGFSSTLPPTHTSGTAVNGTMVALFEPNPVYNDGEFLAEDGGNANQIAVSISAGKAYVLGHELTNTSTRFVSVNKALEYNSVRNGIVPVNIGSYVKVTKVFGKLDVTDMIVVDLYNRYITADGTPAGSMVGTATARYMEYDSGTVGDSSCVYLMSIIDIKMNSGKNFESDVRSIYYDNVGGADFTCNVQPLYTSLTGSVTITNGSSTVTGVGTLFTQQLNPGDAFVVTNGSANTFFNVNTIASNTSLTLTANATATHTGVAISKAESEIYQAANTSAIMSIPKGFVRKLRDIDNESISNAAYYVRQSFSGVVSAGSVVVSTSSSAETFASPQQVDSFIVVNATTGVVLSPSISLNVDSTTATISVGSGANGQTIFVIATVRKVAKERSKTIVRSYTEDFTSQAAVLANTILLAKTDGIKLRKVSRFVNSGGTPIAFGSIPVGSVPVDITSSYVFDGGQRDSHYDFCRIAKAAGVAAPNSPIRVEYDYYEHGSAGDYFSIDSYTGIPPTYTTEAGETISLRDAIDFRVDKTSTTAYAGRDFPATRFDFVSDYTFYLPRIDKVYLSGNGVFGVTQGIAGVDPVEPKVPNDSMHLATLRLLPKTEVVDGNTVDIERIDNRRYTMSDIGKLEKRLQNVEYYTSLNLLEQQTNNLQLFDDNGNLNFKNGFIVDPFYGQSVGDTKSPEYRCSIDSDNNLMRPGFSMDNVSLIESASTDSERRNANYANNDDIITLPFTEVAEIVQPMASRTESVTPFIQFNYLGDMILSPSSDEWFETMYAPAVIVNREGNFNALQDQFRSQLGTVWNAWQTTWTGTTSTDQGWITQNTTTTNQVRSGTTTTIRAVFSSEVVDDRQIRVDIIPWIRSRAVLFRAFGMRPNTLLFPYFDGTSVANWIQPARAITLANKTGEFNPNLPAGSASDHISRRFTFGGVTTQLRSGDVIHNGANNNVDLATATAVVMIDEGNIVKVVNLRGTFGSGQTVYGSLSGVSAQFVSIANNQLQSNVFGEVAGIFTIPSTDALRFATGQKTFALSSGSSFSPSTADTYAEAKYTATGHMNVRQQTIVSTRNGVVQQTSVSENRTLSNTTWIDNTPWWGINQGDGGDPIAQSFTVENSEGMFVTSVDVYFNSKDRSIPVWFYIAEMSNGTPTKNILPGSRITLRPTEVNTSLDGSVATRISMRHPVYLQGQGTEYAFVMGSDSLQYRVFISQLGENDILTGKYIAKQPYLGSMFKSQNASTWNPAQMEDIKFRINRARFNTSVAANVPFIAEELKSKLLKADPFFTKAGSNYVRVFMDNNGLTVGSKVTISGAVDCNGITAAMLNKQHTVLAVEFDSYIIQVTGNAAVTGFGGGNVVYSTKNIKFDVASILATQIEFEGTSLKHFLRPTSTSYAKQLEAVQVERNSNIKMVSPMLVASPENEAAFMGSDKSVATIAELQSSSNYLSPVLDVRRYSLALIGNRIDVPSVAKNVPQVDNVSIGSSTAVSFSGNRIQTVTAQSIFLQAKVGRLLTIAGASNSGNNGSFIISSIATDGSFIEFETASFTTESAGASVSLTLSDNYVSEIAPVDGSAEAKYIMKSLNLDIPANILNIFVDVSKPAGVGVDLYYRLSSGTDVSRLNWIKLNPVREIVNTDNETVYDGVVYRVDSPVKFSSAQVKIVMTSGNTTKVPLVKNLRMIAMS